MFEPGFFEEPGALEVYLHEAKCSDWWLPCLIVLRDKSLVIGLCGHKGPPDAEGAIEISYSIAPTYRCQGFAREAVAALVAESIRVASVSCIRAHTLPERNASSRVLEHFGFSRVGEALDSEEGLLWRWELQARQVTC